MAEYIDYKELQIEALKENLYVIDFCLKFNKKDSSWKGKSTIGCLGIPATVLLCSIIDTIGSELRRTPMQIYIDGVPDKIEKASDHFYILNHNKFFNLNLPRIAINDFYETYRSKLTHNSALSPNNYLSIGTIEDPIYDFNAENKITKVRLVPLFEKTKECVATLEYWLKYASFSEDHKLTNEIFEKSKSLIDTTKNNPSDTGNTLTIK